MKARCRNCECLNFDFVSGKYEFPEHDFCGLHGRTRVDLDGDQPDLNHHGGCGFMPKQGEKARQLCLDFTQN